MAKMDLGSLVTPGDALLIVPPCAGLDRPSLGAHVLQACARERGLRISVLYANILFAAEAGEIKYEAICYAPASAFAGERLFAAAAYGVPHLGRDDPRDGGETPVRLGDEPRMRIRVEELRQMEATVEDWLDRLVAEVVAHRFPVIGCTTTFEQTAASIAILNGIKRLRPEVIAIMGGANCEGEMAHGIRSLSDSVDYIFSGESESSFPEFLQRLRDGGRPENWLVEGAPCLDLDAIPTTDFSEFYQQLDRLLPDSALKESNTVWLPYESSRGCWWGEKKHCTFCGINGQTMAFRAKSPDRVIEELGHLVARHPSKKVCMVDNIMPYGYFKTLIPRLGSELPGLEIFYEEKANLSLDHVVALRSAGVTVIQPGIEALSSPLLKLMEKGVTARQNIALLRYCRSAEMEANWNLLYALPGDTLDDYVRTLELIPLLHHLQPPSGPCHLSIDRFSPYFNRPEAYKIDKLRPIEGYFAVLPERSDRYKVAYHFTGEYRSASRENRALIDELTVAVERWNSTWVSDKPRPFLGLTPIAEDTFLLIDTRGLPGIDPFHFLDRAKASIALCGARLEARGEVAWAVERGLIVELDSCFVPLCTAPPALLREFEVAMGHLHARPVGAPLAVSAAAV